MYIWIRHEWMNEYLTSEYYEWIDEWMNIWIEEWMNSNLMNEYYEWIDEWMNI